MRDVRQPYDAKAANTEACLLKDLCSFLQISEQEGSYQDMVRERTSQRINALTELLTSVREHLECFNNLVATRPSIHTPLKEGGIEEAVFPYYAEFLKENFFLLGVLNGIVDTILEQAKKRNPSHYPYILRREDRLRLAPEDSLEAAIYRVIRIMKVSLLVDPGNATKTRATIFELKGLSSLSATSLERHRNRMLCDLGLKDAYLQLR